MGKSIINKHIDVYTEAIKDLFIGNENMSKGEIIICNDPSQPSIIIKTSDGEIVKILNYDDTNIKETIKNIAPKLSNDIIVAGIDNNFGTGYYKNGDVIKKDTNIEDILKQLLSQELYPTNVKIDLASANAYMNELSLQLDANDVVEVGTLVSLETGTTNGVSVITKSTTISNLTYGYSLENDNERDFDDTTIISDCHSSINDNTFTISASINGFNADSSSNTPVSKSGDGVASLDKTTLGYVSEGNNTITITGTGATYNFNADEITKIYYCSNLGNTNDSNFVEAQSVSGVTKVPEITKSVSVTGKYKWFLGYINTLNDGFVWTSDVIRSLNSGWINKDTNTTLVDDSIETSNGYSIVIACPVKYKLSSINNGIGANIIPNFNQPFSLKIETGGITTDYNIYVYEITNGAKVDYKNVILSKS